MARLNGRAVFVLVAVLAASGIAKVSSRHRERAASVPTDRRPWRCYTLEFGRWRADTPLRQESMNFLPRGVELDAAFITPRAPQQGLRINALAGDRIDVPRSWRPLVPDTIEMRFSTPASWRRRYDIVVRARTDEHSISGIAIAGSDAQSVLSGTRVPCR